MKNTTTTTKPADCAPSADARQCFDLTSAEINVTPKHTPTPWVARGLAIYQREKWSDGTDTGSRYIAQVQSASSDSLDEDGTDASNAEFIVRAVNSHDALVAALRSVLDTFDRQNVPLPAYLRRDEAQARAAIALAEGGAK